MRLALIALLLSASVSANPLDGQRVTVERIVCTVPPTCTHMYEMGDLTNIDLQHDPDGTPHWFVTYVPDLPIFEDGFDFTPQSLKDFAKVY